MKSPFRLFVLGFLCVQLTGIVSFAEDLKGQSYLVDCNLALDFFEKNPGKTIEENFVGMADTPGKMLQLLIDYNAVFSKDFANALLLALHDLGLTKDNSLNSLKSLSQFALGPSDQIVSLGWKTLEKMVDLKAYGQTALGQIKHIQITNLIPTLKASTHRRVFEELVEGVVRYSILDFIVKTARSKDFNRAPFPFLVFNVLYWISALSGAAAVVNYLGLDVSTLFLGTLSGVIVGVGLGTSYVYIKKGIRTLTNGAFAGAHSQSLINLEAKKALGSVFDFLDKETKDGVLSINSACQLGTCHLTPVQIAYMGHLDVLELQSLNSLLRDIMQDTNIENDLQSLSESARTVYDNPTDYTLQLKLGEILSSFLSKMEGVLALRSNAVATLNQYTHSLSDEGIKELEGLSYQKWTWTDDERAKNQLLFARIDADLKNLEPIRIKAEALARKLEKSNGVVEKLRQLLNQLPKTRDRWREAAEEVLLGLDGLR